MAGRKQSKRQESKSSLKLAVHDDRGTSETPQEASPTNTDNIKKKRKPRKKNIKGSVMAASEQEANGKATSKAVNDKTAESHYEKTPGCATTDSLKFEFYSAALVYIRGFNSGLKFVLATNVDGAGALDDVVFSFKTPTEPNTWKTMYVQLKHKHSKSVTHKLLTNKESKFYLPRYFDAYRAIEQTMALGTKRLFNGNFEDCLFVIFTNAKAENLGDASIGCLSEGEAFVWSGTGNVFIFNAESHPAILNCLGDCGQDGPKFLSQFRLFSSQRNPKGLASAMQVELAKLSDEVIRGVDIEKLRVCFLAKVEDWWENRNEILTEDGNLLLRAVDKLCFESASQKTLDMNRVAVAFEDVSAVKPIEDLSVATVVVVCDEPNESSFKLSLTKLMQAIGGQALVLNCEQVLANRDALLLRWPQEDYSSLVICTSEWSETLSKEFFEAFEDNMNRKCYSLVFLVNETVFLKLPTEFREGIKRCKDKFLFSQLRLGSREQVLAKKVDLQGHRCTLSDLLTGSSETRNGALIDTDKIADIVVNAESVMEILGDSESLSLGSSLGKEADHYVERILEQVSVVKDTVFQVGALRETITIRIPAEQRTTSGVSGAFKTSFATFVRNTISYLFSLKYFQSGGNERAEVLIRMLSKSLPVSDAEDGKKEFSLGSYKLSCVRFQTATGVLVSLDKTSSQQASFLFLPDHINKDDATTLSEYHCSKHFLTLKDGKLRWIRSLGKVEAIRPHIDIDQVDRLTPADATDVEGRLVIVCAEPGMGKSTLLARLANTTKNAYKCYFIVSICLSDHVQLFENGKQKDAVGFLLSAMKTRSPLHQSLFEYALKVTGKVVVLLDGLDEISPDYVDKCFELLECLLQTTKAERIWMTSRNLCRKELESRFSMFAVKLSEFDEKDMRNYLTRFWKASADRLNTFIGQLLQKTSQSILDGKKSFLGVPLQIKMLAELYDDEVKGSVESFTLPEVLDLYVLLEEFVEKKCRVYFNEKFPREPNEQPREPGVQPTAPRVQGLGAQRAAIKIFTKGLVEQYSKAALVLIFGNKDIESLLNESIIMESVKFLKEIQCEKDRAGFIDDVVNDKPRFIHRVFAEYFAAKWIADHLAESVILIKSKMLKVEFAVVRNIFDRILVKQRPLHTAVLDENFVQVHELLENNDNKTLHEVKDGGDRTALHLAAGFGTSENREENIRRIQILELLIKATTDFNQVDNVLKGTPLQYADFTNSWAAIDRFLLHMKVNELPLNKTQLDITLCHVTHLGMLETIFDLDLYSLMAFCLENGLQVEHCTAGKGRLLIRACKEGSCRVSKVLIEKNANISIGESNILNDNDKTPLYTASELGHKDLVTQLCSKYVTMQKSVVHHAGNEDLLIAAEYVNHKVLDDNNSTAMHAAAMNGHSEVISVLLQHGGDPLIRNSSNRTPLHEAAKYNHPEAIKILLSQLNETEQAAAVYASDKLQRSVLMYSVLAGCLESVKILVNASGKLSHQEVPNKEEIEAKNRKNYIALESHDELNAVHYAADRGHSEMILFLISKGGDPRSSTSLGVTPLHLALLNGHHTSVKALFDTLDESDRKEEVNHSDFWGDTSLIFAAMGGCLNSVKLLVQAGAKLSYVSGTGRSPLKAAAEGCHAEIVEYLLQQFCEQRKGMENIGNLAESEDCLSAIQFAAQFGYLEIINALIGQDDDPQCRKRIIGKILQVAAANKRPSEVEVLLAAFDEADQAVLVNSSDNEGKSILHFGVFGGCLKCVDLLLEAGGKLINADNDGTTVLMTAAECGLKDIVSYLLRKLDENKERVSIKDYINKTNKIGRTAIHIAANLGHADVVRILVDQGGDALSLDFKRSTPLHVAAQYKKPAALEVLLSVLAEADRPNAVNACDKDGNSVLHCAILGGCLECIDIVIHAGGRLSQGNMARCAPLMAAAECGDQEVLKRLLDNFDETLEDMENLEFVNTADENGLTALHCAAKNGRSDVISILISHDGKPLSQAKDMSTPLHSAAGFRHFEALEVLLASLVETDRITAVNTRDKDGKSVLHYAASGGCVDCVELVVKAIGEDATKNDFIDLQDNDGNTALHYATTNRQSDVVSFLISEGGAPSRRNKHDSTPLHWAATNLNAKAVKFLLEKMAEKDQGDVNSLDLNGDSALICGVKSGCEQSVKYLVRAGGSLSQAAETGRTPLMAAAACGDLKIAKLLFNIVNRDRNIEPKQYINLTDNEGATATHHGARNGHSGVITFLINQGGVPLSLDAKKRSPLHLAAGATSSSALEALLKTLNKKDQAAVINSCDDDGNSLLMYAAMGGNVDCVGHLVKAGGKLTVTNNNLRTPLMAASASNHVHVVEFMLGNFDPVAECMELVDYITMLDGAGKGAYDLADTEIRNFIGAKLLNIGTM